MKDKGKSSTLEKDKISDFNYSLSSDISCIKHPNSSPIGICSFCLKEKLINLISSNDTNTNSSSSFDEKISFLLENEKQSKTEQVILLRSNSKSVQIKQNRNGFWKIKRFFKKKSEILEPIDGGNGVVSRSRSLCSFRGGGGGGDDDYRFSSAKISDVTGGLLFDYTDHVENGGDFKNLKKKFPNSDSLYCSDSSNMLSDSCRILEKNGGDFNNMRKKFTNSDSLCCSNSSNMLQKLEENGGDFKNLRKKFPNSDSSNMLSRSYQILEENGGDLKNMRKKFPNSDSIYCPDSSNMLSHSCQVLQKRHPVTFLKSSNMDDDNDDDDSGFIDLKLDLLSSSKSTLSESKLDFFSESSNSMGNLRSGSCRMNEYDRRMKGDDNNGKGNKVWKWIFRKSGTTSKRDEINSNLIIKS